MPFYKTRTTGKLKSKDATLWRWFSRYIRLRDCNELEYYKCITCGKIFHIRFNGDAGHFCGRRHKATKFNEQNVHTQCEGCNRFGAGLEWEHGQAIDRLHSSGAAEKLKNMAKMNCKRTLGWYDIQIEAYKLKANAEAAKKGFKLW